MYSRCWVNDCLLKSGHEQKLGDMDVVILWKGKFPIPERLILQLLKL